MEKRSYKILNLVTAAIYAMAWTICVGVIVALTIMSSDGGFSIEAFLGNGMLPLVYFYVEIALLWFLPCLLALIHAGFKGGTKFVWWLPVLIFATSMLAPSVVVPPIIYFDKLQPLAYVLELGILRLVYILIWGYSGIVVGILAGKVIRFIKRKIREREEAILAEDLGEYDED